MKERVEDLRNEADRSEQGSLSRASEVRYGHLPVLEREIEVKPPPSWASFSPRSTC